LLVALHIYIPESSAYAWFMSKDTYPKSYVDLNLAADGSGLPFTNHSVWLDKRVIKQISWDEHL
jgi:hypothetical protein